MAADSPASAVIGQAAIITSVETLGTGNYSQDTPLLLLLWGSAMAKKPAQPKPPALKSEESFVELMLVAADFVKSSGGMEPAKKSLEAAGQFIQSAGSTAGAAKALAVLESLKDRISG